jgi:hypothetical protein
MSAPNDGGPAFPRDHAHEGHNGMTLRDYFATKAMHALLVQDGTTHFPQRAKEAFDMADAMLAAREGKA